MTDKQILIDGVDVLKEKINMCFIILLNKLETSETVERTIYEHLDAFIEQWNNQLKAKEQKLKKIEEFRHNYCMNCEDLLKPSHSCKGCNMVELKHLIEGKENG